MPVKHNWNSRRCIRWSRFKDEQGARTAIRVAFLKGEPTKCIWCGAWHIVSPRRHMHYDRPYYLSAREVLAALPPLFIPENADPLRSNGQTARAAIKRRNHGTS